MPQTGQLIQLALIARLQLLPLYLFTFTQQQFQPFDPTKLFEHLSLVSLQIESGQSRLLHLMGQQLPQLTIHLMLVLPQQRVKSCRTAVQ